MYICMYTYIHIGIALVHPTGGTAGGGGGRDGGGGGG